MTQVTVAACRKKINLALVIDGSKGIGRKNFKRCLMFAKALIDSFKISRNQVRVGIVLYSSRVWKISRYQTRARALKAIESLRYS